MYLLVLGLLETGWSFSALQTIGYRNGREVSSLLYMSVRPNILRSITGSICFLDLLGLNNAVIIFIAGDVTELLLCLFIAEVTHLKVPVKYRWNKTGYIQLIKESLPCLDLRCFPRLSWGMDWILLGSAVFQYHTANYSLQYF